ncbi:hypothetical protein QBC46DRAFT_394464 [Diplogelasinospora grovesii]|uniref:Uncharacterized protein n=1 Tax=Diplogelasinospora grovesii TaxID=303347 RepID=A0AAN6N0T2_9PEZI|nr:hypothetical protein QBC46DRAFT_394464 [Diplogelasinospora grovesii]
MAFDVGVGILIPIWGLIGLIDDRHHRAKPSRLPFSGCASWSMPPASKAVAMARAVLVGAEENLRELEIQRHNFMSAKRTPAAIAAELPAQTAHVNAAITRVDAIVERLVAAKKATTEAVRRVGQLSNAALMTAHMSISKQDFAEGILDISEVLVMDPNTAARITPILDELWHEYGGNGMPKKLLDRSNAINDSIAKIIPQEFIVTAR